MDIRQRILLKSHELFNRFGFRRVTMDEIALKTGISKKTIYQSFQNKDELVEAVVLEHIQKSVSICESHSANAENSIHEIFLNFETIHDLVADMNPAFFGDLEKFFPTVFVKTYDHKNNYLYKKVKENLLAGISEGNYRSNIKVDIITKLRIESMFLPFYEQVFPYGKFDMVEVQKEILTHYLYGLVTSSGLDLIRKYENLRLKI